MTRPGPGAAGHQDGVLIGIARLPGDSCPCALILVAERPRWPAEWQSTARALATIIASRIRRVEDTREMAERRAITDALIGAAPDAVVVADAARKIVAFNPAAERLYGRRRADVIGQGMGDLLIPERNRAEFLESTEEFLRSQDPGEYTGRIHLPILRGDGTERTVELTPLPLVVGGQTYFCSFARDVTELERANAALAASEARVRLLSELAPVGIARTDDTGTCAYVNERWCAQNGQLAAAILGTPWLESVHPGDVPRVRREWMRARAAGSELRTDFRLRRHGRRAAVGARRGHFRAGPGGPAPRIHGRAHQRDRPQAGRAGAGPVAGVRAGRGARPDRPDRAAEQPDRGGHSRRAGAG